MTKLASFVRLDYITVKPYLTPKNLLIFTGVALIMLLTNANAAAAIGMMMAFAAIYASYPFAIGEKSNIDALYATLSIKRNTVVLGRYLYAITLDIGSGLFAYALSFALLTVMRKGFDAVGSLVVIMILFFVFSIIKAIQLPIYFKNGYTKAKFLAYLPFIVFPLVFVVLSNIFSAYIDIFMLDWLSGLLEWFAANPLPTVLLVAAIWLIMMAISYKVSLSFYSKRDF